MGILTRPLLRPQQRWDLEDYNTALSALRADSHFYTKTFISDKSSILQGFTISQTFVGQPTADITMDDATLVNGDNTGDFSWWTAPDAPDPITIPTGVGGLQAGRNYVELELFAQDGTPLQRAFWDPTANSGAGVEFTQEVNTVTELFVGVKVNQTGFNVGNPNRIKLAIIDLDGSSNIRGIQDKRDRLFRLGTGDDINSNYTWGAQTEPTTLLTFTVASPTPFVAGEIATFTSGATATVVTGGNNNIQVVNFSTVNYQPGDTVTGGTSGGSSTLLSYYNSFTGADKDIRNYSDMFRALMTEIKRIKGTQFWFEVGSPSSLPSLLNYINSIIAGISNGARFHWSGTNLSITDALTTGQASSDIIAGIRIPGYASDVLMARQDGTGGSTTLAIPDKNILFVKLPTPGSNRTFSQSGSGPTNYQVTPIGSFIPSDANFVLAYREGTKVIITGLGELKAGESIDVSSELSKEILAFIGAADDTSTNPPYTTTPSADLSNQFTTQDSLTQSSSINAANINDIAKVLLRPYQEPKAIISGSPSNTNQLQGPISSGTMITLPLDSRDSSAVRSYRVGAGGLWLFLNGQEMLVDDDFAEVGSLAAQSTQIQILRDLVIGDVLEFRLINPQFFGTGGADQPFYVNYIIGQNGSDVPVGALYNLGTDKLQVWRNGLMMNKSLSVGDAIDRYQESTPNSVALAQAADPSEIFAFVNHETPNPGISLITGFAGTVLTVPTYTMGNGELRIFRNGILLSTNASAPTDLKYTETSTTSITLALAAGVTDVFKVFRAGTPPTWRKSLTGTTGTHLVIPGAVTFTPGSPKLLVFRNGLLIADSLVLGNPVDRYQQSSNNAIDLEGTVPAVMSDLFEFIYV